MQVRLTTPEIVTKDAVRVVEVRTREGGLGVRFSVGTVRDGSWVSHEEREITLEARLVPAELQALVAHLAEASLDLLVDRGVVAGTKEGRR